MDELHPCYLVNFFYIPPFPSQLVVLCYEDLGSDIWNMVEACQYLSLNIHW